MAAKKKTGNGFTDVSKAARDRHSDDGEVRAAAEAEHGAEMFRRAVASSEGGGGLPRDLLYQRILPRTRWPK